MDAEPVSTRLHPGRRVAPRGWRGFTLLELLVAISIAAVMMVAVGLSIRGADRSLQTDAERVALLLGLAREEAQVRGATIRFEADASAYRFVIRRGERWLPIIDDRDLRPREWTRETRLALRREDGLKTIEFGRDLVDSPFELVLGRDGQTQTVYANGLGVFEVQ